jgi:hypothetical protein
LAGDKGRLKGRETSGVLVFTMIVNKSLGKIFASGTLVSDKLSFDVFLRYEICLYEVQPEKSKMRKIIMKWFVFFIVKYL